jgi:hypothetical protein
LKRGAPDFKEMFTVLFALMTRQKKKEEREGKQLIYLFLIHVKCHDYSQSKESVAEFP